jgi:phosphoribosylformylglycinamidine cyclo-ligase
MEADCSLVGGETAILPDFYQPGDYDMAGFCVGVVERDAIVDGRTIVAGDALLGLASTGFHSNGYSLVRRVFAELALDARLDGVEGMLGEPLLRPTRIYVKALRRLAAAGLLKGAAHVTGGGLVENPPRMLPPDARLGLRIDLRAWTPPPLFAHAQRLGGIADDEMRRTFNLGIGMVVCVARDRVAEARRLLAAEGETVFPIGEVVPAGTAGERLELVG